MSELDEARAEIESLRRQLADVWTPLDQRAMISPNFTSEPSPMQQQKAWLAVFRALKEAGLYSFVATPITATGAERCVQFIRQLAEKSKQDEAEAEHLLACNIRTAAFRVFHFVEECRVRREMLFEDSIEKIIDGVMRLKSVNTTIPAVQK